MLQAVCKDLASWRTITGYEKLNIAINCSLQQAKKSNIYRLVHEIPRSHELPEKSIIVEMREDVFSSEDEQVVSTVELLRDSDATLLLDGFFYSDTSPLLLRKWRPDCIKVDMFSLARKYDSEDDKHLFADLVTIVKELSGAPVHAGRVESAEHLAMVQGSGCEIAQGYYLSESLDAPSVRGLLGE
jgi:EAL domain-containing protein (putative c-di-GMP-specific phosphodiesterase class I)